MGTVQPATWDHGGVPMPTGPVTARAWCEQLPDHDRSQVTPELIAEVDALPAGARRDALSGWRRAAAAGLFESAILRTIVDVVAAHHVELPASA